MSLPPSVVPTLTRLNQTSPSLGESTRPITAAYSVVGDALNGRL
jgi:hypothetical protein